MGMNNVIIEVVARFTDHVSGNTKAAQESIDRMGKTADSAQQKLDGLGRKRVKPSLDADSSGFSSKVRDAEARANSFSGRTYSAMLKMKDSGAFQTLGKLKSGLHTIASGAWTATVKLKDGITAPLNDLKKRLFNLKSIATGLVSGALLQKYVAGPIATKFVTGPVQQYANYEDLVTQFGVLLGDQDAAKQRMSDLVKFAGQTPFTRDEIFQASRVLQTYTGGALATPDATGGLKMIGDVAAMTGQSYERVANYFGRLYNEVGRGGEALGEPLMMLREIGALSAENEEHIKKIATGSGTIGEKWAQIAQEFSKSDGMMEAMSNQMNNLMLGVKSFLRNNLYMKLGEGISESLKPFLVDFRTWRNENSDLIAGWAERVKSFAALMSGRVLDSVRRTASRADTLFRSDEFRNATLSGKIRLTWDTLVADPLTEWWTNGGQEKTAAAANRIGGAIGGMLGGAILGVLGFTTRATSIGSDGGSVANSFVQGFLDRFDGDAIRNAIKQAVSDTWTTFKESSTGGKIITAAILGKVGSKYLGPWLKAGGSILKGGGGLIKWLLGRNRRSGGDAGAGSLAQSVGTMYVSAGAVYVNGPTIGGPGNGWPTPPASVPGAPALPGGPVGAPKALPPGGGAGASSLWSKLLPFAEVVSAIAMVAGGIKGGQDLYRGHQRHKAGDENGGNTLQAAGMAEWGGILAGAALGTVLFPGIGTLIGGGAGALAGLFTGKQIRDSEKLAEHTKEAHASVKDRAFEARSMGRQFEQSVLYLDKMDTKLTDQQAKWTGRTGKAEGAPLPRVEPQSRTRGRQFEEEVPVRIKPKPTIESGGLTDWQAQLVGLVETTGPKNIETPVWISPSYVLNNREDPSPLIRQSVPQDVNSTSSVHITAGYRVGNKLTDSALKSLAGVKSSYSASTTLNLAVNLAAKVVGSVQSVISRAKAAAGIGQSFRGGIFGGPSALQSFSDGGIVRGGSRLIQVAEEGTPEMVIPLSSQRRKRGQQLWEQAGHMLRVPGFARGGHMLRVPGFARGGQTDGQSDSLRSIRYTPAEAAAGSGETRIEVGGVTVHLTVQASSGGSVADEVRAQKDEIVSTVARAINEALAGAFQNTPRKGGAA